jgi:hypothetical protein
LRAIFVAVVLSAALAAGAAAAVPPNRASMAETLVASPDLTYQIPFVINCSEATWRKVLDNPWLMGQLWNVYGYAPPYKVGTAGDGLHIDDPTGLVGDLWLVRNGLAERRYFATGRLNFRAVPFFNSGQAVTIVRSQAAGPQIRGTLQLYIRADRAVSRAVVWAGKSLVQTKVEARVRSNVYDGVRLVEQIASAPDAVLRQLQGPAAETFRTVFLPPKPPPRPTPPKPPKGPRSTPKR